MTVVEELVSVLGLEIGEDALATLTKFKTAVNAGLAGVGGIVAALGAAFAGTVYSVAEFGNEMSITALKLGVSTDALQEMKYAADLSGVSFESLTTAIKFLSKNAGEGSDAAKRVFEAFSGVAMRDAKGNLKTADVLLEDFADKIAKTKDPIKQVELAMHALHGRSGAELLPLLKQGKEGIQRLRQEAQDLGLVLDTKTIASSRRFEISLKKLKNSLFGIRNTLGAPFIDDFADGLDYVTEKVYSARIWFQTLTVYIRELGQRFRRVVEVMKAAGDGIHKFVLAMKLDQIADAIDWVHLLEAALIGVAAIATVSALATAASWLIAAAPFLLIATLIGLIVDDIAHFVQGQDSVLGRAQEWAKRFNENDAPEIKFFKSLLGLLFDLGDPNKWNRVGKAAKDGFFPFVEWLAKIRQEEPLKTILDLITGQSHISQDVGDAIQKKFELSRAKSPGEIAQIEDKYAYMKAARNGDQAGMNKSANDMKWDASREKFRKPFEVSDKERSAMSEEQWAAWVRQQQGASQYDRFKRGKSYSDAGGELSAMHARGEIPEKAWDMMKKQQGAQMTPVHQEIEIHIHDATDPQKVAEHVRRELDNAHSDAKAAIAAHPGGS